MKRLLIAVLVVGVLLASTGCIQSFKSVFWDKGEKKGYTQAEIEAAYDYALKSLWMEFDEETGTYSIDTTTVSVEDVYNVAGSVLDDIDYVLNPDRSAWWKFAEELPTLREAMLREEQRWTYIQSQMGQVKLYLDFRKLLGDRISEEDKEYKIEYLWPDNFDADFGVEYVDNAREEGKLREVERHLSYLYTPYGEKLPDPKNPTDPNAFVWEEKLQGFLVVSYRILNDKIPEKLSADYVEIFRAKVEDDYIVTESLPCARAYRKVSGNSLNVLILDLDAEGEPGYGTIDEVHGLAATVGSKIVDGYDIYMKKLATSRTAETDKRRVVERPELEVQIVRAGEVERWRGEFNEEGWTVPYNYVDEFGIDWLARVEKKDKPAGYPFYEIDYMVKTWADKTVWEYYLPAEEYAGELEKVTPTGRSMMIQLRGEDLVTVAADKVCGDLYAIVYRDSSEWVKIADLDGTGILQYKIIDVPNPGGTPLAHNVPPYAEPRGL